MSRYDAKFVSIPMRDGVMLGAVLYRPLDAAGPVPTIMEMTPYLADNLHADAIATTREGFAFLAVDCRGRGNSGGEFRQWVNDGPDGYDVIEWIARQPWSDGQVGLMGGSYTGWNQWAIAGTLPPALKTIVPSAAYMGGQDLPRNGIGTPYQYRWRVTLKGQHISWNLAADTLLFNRIQTEIYARNGSLLDVPKALGFEAPGWEDDLTNTAWSPLWESRIPSPQALAKLDIPVLTLTGHYDTCQRGTLAHLRRLEQYGSDATRAKTYLVFGPWDHRGMDGTDQVYGLKFGPAAKLDVPKLRFEWYRWAFGQGEFPKFLDARVKYYVCGAEEWRSADSIESLRGTPMPLYLASSGMAADVFHSGQLADAPADTPPDGFVSDPFDLRPLETEQRLSRSPELASGGGAVFPRAYNSLMFIMGGEDPTNGVFCYNTFGQGVIYHSAPLEAPLEVVGVPRLHLWVSVDTPDADIAILLYEVLEDGSVVFLSSEQLRLRHRDGSAQGKPMPANEPVELRLDDLRFTSRRLERHSRLRLVIRATACSFMQKNLNSATPVHEQRPEEARVAHIRVLHDSQHPSALLIPLAPGSKR